MAAITIFAYVLFMYINYATTTYYYLSHTPMITPFDYNSHTEFDDILDDDERIMWVERPQFAPYFLTELSSGLGILLVLYIFTNVSNLNIFNALTWDSWFVIIPIGGFVWNFSRRMLSYSNSYYAYTDKRVMIRSGIQGTDYQVIEYEKISIMNVKANIIERLFGVGTIRFFTGKTYVYEGTTKKIYDQWESIPNHHDVFKSVQKIMRERKNDYNPLPYSPYTNRKSTKNDSVE